MAENTSFLNISVNVTFVCTSFENSIHFEEWILHVNAAITYVLVIFAVFITIKLVRNISMNPENTLFIAALSFGWLCASFYNIPTHLLDVFEYNRGKEYVQCNGYTYNKNSRYPGCRINFILSFIVTQFFGDMCVFSLTILSCFKFAAVQFPIWSRCYVTTKYSYRGVLSAIILSGILNIPEALVRNFPSSKEQDICLDIIDETFIIPKKMANYGWFIFHPICFITVVCTAVFIVRGVFHKESRGHRSESKKKKQRQSIVRNIIFVPFLLTTYGSVFALRCDMKLGIFYSPNVAQYLELTGLVGFIACMLLYSYTSERVRNILCRNCRTKCWYKHELQLKNQKNETKNITNSSHDSEHI